MFRFSGAFSDPFSPARPVAARFRSENRLSPRTPRTRRSFRGISRRLAPFAIFARECLGKRAGNAVLKAFWSLERLLAALFRGGGPLRLVFWVRKPPFQPENRKIRPQINANGSRRSPANANLLPPTCQSRCPIKDLQGVTLSVNVLPPAEGLCAFDPRCSFQRAEIINYRTDPFN